MLCGTTSRVMIFRFRARMLAIRSAKNSISNNSSNAKTYDRESSNTTPAGSVPMNFDDQSFCRQFNLIQNERVSVFNLDLH